MAEAAAPFREADERPRRQPLRPWLQAGQTLAEWLDSLEDEPPPGEDMLPMIAPHARAMRHTAEALDFHYRDGSAEVGFDMPVVFRLRDERGVAVTRRLSPDVFVAFGSQRDLARKDYDATTLKPPDFVLEVLSKSTWERDVGPKLDAYALIGVRECFLFDPTGAYMAPPLRGYSLSRTGGRPYAEERLPGAKRGVRSNVLRLVAHVERPVAAAGQDGDVLFLRWHDPTTGENLRTYAEQAEARAAVEARRDAAEQARLAAEQARLAAERQREELEERNRQLEALVRQLRGQ